MVLLLTAFVLWIAVKDVMKVEMVVPYRNQ